MGISLLFSSCSDRGEFELQKTSRTLVIPNVDFSDGGIYVCKGSNNAGFRLKYFNVTIMGK